MKHFLFIVLMSSFCFGQTELMRIYAVLPECEESKDLQKCYESKVINYIKETITKEQLKEIIQQSKNDIIFFYPRLYFDVNGNLIKKRSHISTSITNVPKNLDILLNTFPKVKPILDEFSNGIIQYIPTSYVFEIDREQNKLIPIENYVPEEVHFSVIEQVPIYSTCSINLDNQTAKKCFNKAIQKHVIEHFNLNSAPNLGLTTGKKRISLFFAIDETGHIINIKARGPHPVLEKEAIRVAQLIPKMKQPGIQREKPVIVLYYLPIIITVE